MRKANKWLSPVAGVGLVLALVWFLILDPAFRSAWRAAVPTRTTKHCKQLTTALLLYASDNDGAVPSGSKWEGLIASYSGSQVDTLVGPFIETQPVARFALNKYAQGRVLANAEKEERIVLIFVSNQTEPNSVGDKSNWIPSGIPTDGTYWKRYLAGFTNGTAKTTTTPSEVNWLFSDSKR